MTARTTTALLGDLLAGMPGEKISVQKAADLIERHRSGVDQAVSILSKVEAISIVQDPDDRRRTAISMSKEQAQAWSVDAGAGVAVAAVFNLEVAPLAKKAAAASIAGAKARRAPPPLRFGVWGDGALIIDGLGRKQLTLPAQDTGALAQMLASLPEGALQALGAGPLKPSFCLAIGGRDYPLSAQQAGDLVAYIEQLPARAIRTTGSTLFTAVPRAGTDHRVHRIETPGDRAPIQD